MRHAYKALIVGGLAGFLFGLGTAIQLSLANRFFHLGMFRSVIREAAQSGTAGTVLGCLAGLALYLALWLMPRRVQRDLRAPKPDRHQERPKRSTRILVSAPAFLLWAWIGVAFIRSPVATWRTFLLETLLLSLVWLILLREAARISALAKRIGQAVLSARFLRATVIFLVSVISGLQLGRGLSGGPPQGSMPNVVIVVADALRAASLGCYGSPTVPTPNIDQLAAEGVLFEQAMSPAPWTKPSIASLMTGLLPREHLVLDWTDSLKTQSLTLAESLRDLGYGTFCAQTNPSISAEFDFDQGFEDYLYLPLGQSQQVVDAFQSWLKGHGQRPFFAYLHLMDTHFPYNAADEINSRFDLRRQDLPNGRGFETVDVRILDVLQKRESDRAFLADLYDRSIEHVDRTLSRILDQIGQWSSAQETIFVFTADHGEEFWEHGGFAHGHSLYNELLKVPLIIRYRKLGRGKRISATVELNSVPQIVMDMIKAGESRGGDWGDRLVARIGEEFRDESPSYFEGTLFGPVKLAVVSSGWKLIKNTDRIDPVNPPILGALTRYVYPRYRTTFELYDLIADPLETNNVINENREIARRLHAQIIRFFDLSENLSSSPGKITRRKAEQLRSLGYLR